MGALTPLFCELRQEYHKMFSDHFRTDINQHYRQRLSSYSIQHTTHPSEGPIAILQNSELVIVSIARRTLDNVRGQNAECGIYSYHFALEQRFSSFVRPQPGKFFFHKTRARSQKIYS